MPIYQSTVFQMVTITTKKSLKNFVAFSVLNIGGTNMIITDGNNNANTIDPTYARSYSSPTTDAVPFTTCDIDPNGGSVIVSFIGGYLS